MPLHRAELSIFRPIKCMLATPEPTAIQPQVEVPAPTTHPETKTAPASEPKNAEEPSQNGKTDKKKGRITAMMLALFAVITGHQGTTR